MLQKKSTSDYSTDIAAALATPGDHLPIGRGGFILHYRNGAMFSGYGCEAIETQSSLPDYRSSTADTWLSMLWCN